MSYSRHPVRRIVRIKCDEPMRRSKESAEFWECSGKCETCICCLEIEHDGTVQHYKPTQTHRKVYVAKCNNFATTYSVAEKY